MAHGDYTGSKKALLAQRYADEQQLAASNMSLVTQVVQEGRDSEVDLFTEEDHRLAEPQYGQGDDGVMEVNTVDPAYKAVKFRASETVEQVTVGKDRTFTIEAGRTYVAPRWVVAHLDDKELVWH